MKDIQIVSQHSTLGAVAEINQLGSLRREFAPEIWMYMIVYGWFFIGWLVAIGYFSYSHPFPGEPLVTAIFLSVCALIALIFLVALIVTYLRRNRRVYVYEHGLIVVHDKAVEAVRWDEIAIVWHRVKTRRRYRDRHTYTLQLRDDRTVRPGYFSTNQELGDIIEQETADLLFPEALDAYQQGQGLSFGPLILDQSGITYKGRSLPWSEVARIQLERGSLSIKRQGKFFAWANVAYGKIPNLRVLQRISTKVAQGKSPEE